MINSKKVITHVAGVLLVLEIFALYSLWGDISRYNQLAKAFWSESRTPILQKGKFNYMGYRQKQLGRSSRLKLSSKVFNICVDSDIEQVPYRITKAKKIEVLCGYKHPYIVEVNISGLKQRKLY